MKSVKIPLKCVKFRQLIWRLKHMALLTCQSAKMILLMVSGHLQGRSLSPRESIPFNLLVDLIDLNAQPTVFVSQSLNAKDMAGDVSHCPAGLTTDYDSPSSLIMLPTTLLIWIIVYLCPPLHWLWDQWEGYSLFYVDNWILDVTHRDMLHFQINPALVSHLVGHWFHLEGLKLPVGAADLTIYALADKHAIWRVKETDESRFFLFPSLLGLEENLTGHHDDHLPQHPQQNIFDGIGEKVNYASHSGQEICLLASTS